MFKVIYIPNQGPYKIEEGGDFMLNNTLKYARPQFKIIPRRSQTLIPQELEQIDIVHNHSIWTVRDTANTIKTYTKQKKRPKFIGGVRGEVGLLKTRDLIKHYDAIHVDNQSLYERVEKINPNVHMLYPGVDTQLFKYKGEPPNFCIGWVGGSRKPEKNFHLLHKLGYPVISARIENYVPHNKIPQIINACSVYVCPSSDEGCNRGVLEAAACERPIISTEAGTVRDILDDEWIISLKAKPGVIREKWKLGERKAETFIREAKKKLETLKSDPELRRRVGKENRARVMRFSWPTIIKEQEEIWKKVLG